MKIAILEGLLFLAGDEGLNDEIIKEVLEIDEIELNELVEQLKHELQNPQRGLVLLKLSNKYKLATKKEHYEYYEKLVDNPTNFTFSNAALETLAIIAYNQPITRIEVEKIRGVNSDNIIRRLLNRSLIKESGRKEGLGRAMTYSITDDFLNVFNLKSIDELPKLKNLNLDLDDNLNIFETNFKDDEND